MAGKRRASRLKEPEFLQQTDERAQDAQALRFAEFGGDTTAAELGAIRRAELFEDVLRYLAATPRSSMYAASLARAALKALA